MITRYYFSDHNDERCYTMKSMLDWMRVEGMETLIVYPAKIIVGDDYFFCSYHDECGVVGESCGKDCNEYAPRNGKNGRCRYSRNCYEPLNGNPITLNQQEKSNE